MMGVLWCTTTKGTQIKPQLYMNFSLLQIRKINIFFLNNLLLKQTCAMAEMKHERIISENFTHEDG